MYKLDPGGGHTLPRLAFGYPLASDLAPKTRHNDSQLEKPESVFSIWDPIPTTTTCTTLARCQARLLANVTSEPPPGTHAANCSSSTCGSSGLVLHTRLPALKSGGGGVPPRGPSIKQKRKGKRCAQHQRLVSLVQVLKHKAETLINLWGAGGSPKNTWQMCTPSNWMRTPVDKNHASPPNCHSAGK